MNAFKYGGDRAAKRFIRERLRTNAEFLAIYDELMQKELIKTVDKQCPYPPTPQNTGKTK